MTPLIIIQARMGSTRFPGKVLAPLAGRPVISRVIDSCWKANIDICVACSDTEADDPLATYLEDEWDVFRGSEGDVLGRYARAAYENPDYDTIIRITGDCPLVDHRTITALVYEHAQRGVPYLGRTNDPDGNDVEVFTRDILMEAAEKCGPHQREHVTTWMRQHPDAVKIDHELYKDVKYSVDTVDDLRTCEELISRCGQGAEFLGYVAALRRWKETA